MEVIVRPDADAAVGLVARLLEGPAARDARARARSGHRSHDGARLRRAGALRGLVRGAVRSFNLDEYVGLSPDDPRSYHHYMHEHLFSRVDIDPADAHVPAGHAPDLAAAGDRVRAPHRRGGRQSTCSCWASARRATSASTSRCPRSPRARATSA